MTKKTIVEAILLGLFIIAASIFYISGLADVPFHPDESTQIFMSGDWEIFFENPSNLFWSPEKTGDLRQHYRLLDAPLTRWMIGLGRAIAAQPAQPADWDWSYSWAQNAKAGALPSDKALLTARLSVAWLYPLTLLVIYAIGRQIGGKIAGWSAAVLLAANPLVLLHTRRAMAESALLFFALLTIWVVLYCRKHPWLIALPLTLAFNAKQSSIALFLPGIFALLWQPIKTAQMHRRRQVAFFGAIAILVTFLLNPFIWSNPFQAARQALIARRDFTIIQVRTLRAAGYGAVTQTVSQRISGALVQTFIAAPAVYDVSNYAEITRSAEWNYFSNPLHKLLRGRRGGFSMMLLTLLGFVLAVFRCANKTAHNRRALTLLLIFSLVQSITLIMMFEITFQRYYLLLIPYVCLWSGFALQELFTIGRRTIQQARLMAK